VKRLVTSKMGRKAFASRGAESSRKKKPRLRVLKWERVSGEALSTSIIFHRPLSLLA